MVLDLPGGLFEQSDVRETPAGTSTSSSTIIAPIGSIMAWLKSFANTPQDLPTGWVEADGSVVDDADSVYDTQTLPDLNGGEFIRGDATSGGTGGSDTMAHTHTTNVTIDNHTALDIANDTHDHNDTFATGNESSHTHTITANTNAVETGAYPYRLMGITTSGGSAHNHSVTGSVSNDTHSHGFDTNIDAHTENNPATSAASNTENRPKYYNVVWIMRIK